MTAEQDKNEPDVIMVIDIRQAHFHADVQEPTYVELPPEEHEEGMCARLIKVMYGLRQAAASLGHPSRILQRL